MMRRGFMIAVCVGLWGCTEANPGAPAATPPVTLASDFEMVISDAIAAPGGSLAAGTRVYMSLAPFTIPDGTVFDARNRRTGAKVSAVLNEGGIDPLAIEARAGDTLDLSVEKSNRSVLHSTQVVSALRPPRIVRTVPPRGKTVVPLDARITVVFSEPMDASSLTSDAVQLLLGAEIVPGQIAVEGPDRLSITYTPAASLTPEREYTVRVTTEARDLSGQHLEAPSTSAFVTESAPPQVGTFVLAGDMTTARVGHTATLLPDGRVLITGGDGFEGNGRTAEIYDPASGTFSRTGDMLDLRVWHTATLLPNGQVLIVGGNQLSTRAELYDPATGRFSPSGSMLTKQYIQSATLLRTGKVLLGGDNSAELYDPAMGTFQRAGSYAIPIYAHQATVLNDGRVLFAGDPTGQLYDPARDTFTLTGSTGLDGTEMQTTTLLTNGKVLMAGGMGIGRYSYAVLYDPATGTFSRTGSLLWGRDAHDAALLRDGRVLIVGGDGQNCQGASCAFAGSLASAELYDVSRGGFVAAGSMRVARTGLRATTLQNGDVLITGGFRYCGIGCMLGPTRSVELYHPAGAAATVTRLGKTQ